MLHLHILAAKIDSVLFKIFTKGSFKGGLTGIWHHDKVKAGTCPTGGRDILDGKFFFPQTSFFDLRIRLVMGSQSLPFNSSTCSCFRGSNVLSCMLGHQRLLQVSLIAPHLAWRRQALLLQEGAADAWHTSSVKNATSRNCS